MTITVYENSYLTLDEAEDYFSQRLYCDAWDNATSDEQEKAIITASKKVDNFSFIGIKKLPAQTMEFPRFYAQDLWDYYETFNLESYLPELPQDIKDAVCEEALSILDCGNSAHFKNQKMGINSVSLAGDTVSYNEIRQGGLLSPEAYKLVVKWTRKGF